jgi:ABC-type phosphate transport system permease subunit
MFEHKSQPLASRRVFMTRVFKHTLIASFIILIFLVIGIIGYHYTAGISWLDAFYNSSMILSGMGPQETMSTQSSKLFSSFYALFSVIVFIANISILIAPTAHRFMHKLHLEEE